MVKCSSPIRQIRKQKAIRLADLSGKVGVSIAYLSDIERGNRHGSLAVRQSIADALGVPVESLTGKEVEDGAAS